MRTLNNTEWGGGGGGRGIYLIIFHRDDFVFHTCLVSIHLNEQVAHTDLYTFHTFK